MSSHDHGHAIGGDHVPHVLPYAAYFATWGALMFFTIITVGASYVNFGPANLLIAVVIATLKATIVAAIFMHLWFDHRMHSMILASAGLFLAIFIAFTMFDTESRGHMESIAAERPADVSNPFNGGSARQKAMNALYPVGSNSVKLSAPGVVPGVFDVPAAPSASAAPEASASAAPQTSASGSASASASVAASGSASASVSASASTSAAPSASAPPKH